MMSTQELQHFPTCLFRAVFRCPPAGDVDTSTAELSYVRHLIAILVRHASINLLNRHTHNASIARPPTEHAQSPCITCASDIPLLVRRCLRQNVSAFHLKFHYNMRHPKSCGASCLTQEPPWAGIFRRNHQARVRELRRNTTLKNKSGQDWRDILDVREDSLVEVVTWRA